MRQPISRQNSELNSILDQDLEIKRLISQKLGHQVLIKISICMYNMIVKLK